MRLTDALRLECRPLGIQVLLVAPGFIDTQARSTAKVRLQLQALCVLTTGCGLVMRSIIIRQLCFNWFHRAMPLMCGQCVATGSMFLQKVSPGDVWLADPESAGRCDELDAKTSVHFDGAALCVLHLQSAAASYSSNSNGSSKPSLWPGW